MPQLLGKKILFLITQSHYGGAQRYVLQLARHFQKNNKVLIAVGCEDEKDSQFFEESRNCGIEPIIVKSLAREVSLIKTFDALLEIRRLLVTLRPDIIHANSSMAGAIGSLAAWLYRFDPLNQPIRAIYTVHGFVFNEPLPPLKKRIYRWVETTSASWKSALITVSDYDRTQGLVHRIAPAARMVTIHNGIDLAMTFQRRDEARRALRIPDDTKQMNIGTIASLYPTKGLPFLIDAIHQLHTRGFKATFYILGEGPERKSLTTQIQERGLNATVHLLGNKPNAAHYLKAFDLFVLPSVKEGFPLTLLEAGLAQVPVIATSVGGIPELIESGTNGILVPAGDATALANAIQQFAGDTQQHQRCAANLRQKVIAHFSEEIMLRKTEELYLRFFLTTSKRTETAQSAP